MEPLTPPRYCYVFFLNLGVSLFGECHSSRLVSDRAPFSWELFPAYDGSNAKQKCIYGNLCLKVDVERCENCVTG